MKTSNATIETYISSIKQSQNFKNRIAKVLPTWVECIIVEEVGMKSISGYGQYQNYIKFTVNDEYVVFNKRHTCAPCFDGYKAMDDFGTKVSNYHKNMIIDLLEDYFNSI